MPVLQFVSCGARAMKLWACFVCGSEKICKHREPELVAWMAGISDEQARELVEHEQAKKPVGGTSLKGITSDPARRDGVVVLTRRA